MEKSKKLVFEHAPRHVLPLSHKLRIYYLLLGLMGALIVIISLAKI